MIALIALLAGFALGSLAFYVSVRAELKKLDAEISEKNAHINSLDRVYRESVVRIRDLQDEAERLKEPHVRCNGCEELVLATEALEDENKPNVWSCLECLPTFCDACGRRNCDECGGCPAPCRLARKNHADCECEKEKKEPGNNNVIPFPGNTDDA